MKFGQMQGKKVLVTGSSSGIGAATAVEFARQGCFVGVHYFRTKQGGEKTLSEVKKHSEGILVQADCREQSQVKEMVEGFAETAGGIDILVNNAGDLIERQSFESASVEYHDNIYATNVRSVFLVTQAALPYLKKSKGCIVNVGSLAGHTGGGGGSGMYAGAKAAIHTEAISMAKEFGRFGIRVNVVCPGLIETRFHEKFSTDERKKKVAHSTPLGRNGTPQDIANAIVFLASDAASFITGEYLAVNGGLFPKT